MPAHMVVHVCFGVDVYVQGQLATPWPHVLAGGSGHRPVWLNPGYGPSRKTEKKKRKRGRGDGEADGRDGG